MSGVSIGGIQLGDDYPLVGFYFGVAFSGNPTTTDSAFQEVSGITVELSTEDYQEGGENRFQWKLPGVPKYSNITLKRGVLGPGSLLRQWCSDTIQGEFTGGLMSFGTGIEPQTVFIFLYDSLGIPIMNWCLYNAYPVKWEISSFESTKNEVVVETIELAYTYFTQI